MAANIEITTDLGILDLMQGAENEFYVTRQIKDLRNFQTVNADFTKTLKVPATPNNVKILRGAALLTGGSVGGATAKIRCSVVLEGLPVAPVAWLLVESELITPDHEEFDILRSTIDCYLPGTPVRPVRWRHPSR